MSENESMMYYTQSSEHVLKHFAVDEETGLSRTVTRERLEQYGPNDLIAKNEVSLWRIFVRQFISPFVYMLVGAAGISFFLDHQTDAYIILVAVALTVAFGFWQEAKAERTLDALRKLVKQTATVLREGSYTEVSVSDIVPGDVLIVEEGDRVSADARMVSVSDLQIDESALTGEAEPQGKHVEQLPEHTQVSDQENMIFRGTVVVRGKGVGVVVHTGNETELGKIATTVTTISERKTPLQLGIQHLAYILTVVIVVTLGLLVVTGFFRGADPVDLLTTAIAVAVAAIPESLVVAVTVILAIGMMKLAKRKALVRKLVSAETLGSTTVACVDKTGTITEGRMSIGIVETHSKNDADSDFAVLLGMAANEGYFENVGKDGDLTTGHVHAMPTDAAFLRDGVERGLGGQYKRVHERITDTRPFSSETKYMATLSGYGGMGARMYVKGAPDTILDTSTKVWKGTRSDGAPNVRAMSASVRTDLTERINELSRKGYRVLAVGYKDTKGACSSFDDIEGNPLDNIVFVGLVGLLDPVRESVSEAMSLAQDAGMRIVMITGDHKLTAQAVAERIGLPCGEDNVLDGSELKHMTDQELAGVAPHISVYSRIVPNDKLRIVKALQSHDEVVAMTGDGVNDAPALKQADVGVAMGSGQDVAKEASDVIVLDNDFKTIIDAVKQGRVILDNIRKVVLYLLKDTFSEIILLGLAIIAGLPLPILAAQVLWINIVEDGFPAFALSYEPAENDVMKLKPEGKGRKLLTREMQVIIFAIGIITDILLLGLFIWFTTSTTLEIDYIRTIIFAALACNSLFVVFSLKSLRHSLLSIPIFNNGYLIGSVLFGVVMLCIAIYVPFISEVLYLEPLSLVHWGLVVTISIIQVVLIEMVKYVFTHENAFLKISS